MSVRMERRKAGSCRQENACLITDDEQLLGDLDALSHKPGVSKLQVHPNQVHPNLSNVMVSSSVAAMSEHIRQLEAELEAQTEELRAAELSAESCQEAAAHSDAAVATLTHELRTLREELDNRAAIGKRAEQQRNQALQNAETLKEAFKDYKDTISVTLQKVTESQKKLKESLMESDREKEELQMKFTVLEREKAEQDQTVSQLQEELRQTKAAAAHLQAQVDQVGRKASHLEQQVSERGAECREAASLRRQVEELRTLTRSQEQKLDQSHREAQQNQAELASLEAILALLHLQQAPAGPICSNPCMLPPLDYSGAAHLLKLKAGEGYQQLLRVLQAKDAERLKQRSVNEQLQERLSRAQEEISSLQSSMAQRASHYQNTHTELLERVSQAADTQKELKRKSARVAALEKQLQEKSSAYSLAALKNGELEKELQEKSSSIQQYQTLMTKKQKEYQQSLEQCKQSHSNQLAEQQHRVEMLQLSMEEARCRVLEMERQLDSLQRERDDAQKAAVLLQTSVDQLTQEKQVEVRQNQELLQSFKDQASYSATKISELQSCLSACREELNSYLRDMEDVKRNCETELQRKNEKLSSLQAELHSTTLVCQSSSEQNLQLQVSLQQQQAMLTESTARVSELEDSQSRLQSQVSSLELQLERARASLQDEIRSRELEMQAAHKNLQEMSQQNAQLSKSISHLTSEMQKCRTELELELEHQRSQVAVKGEQISGLEQKLQQMKNQIINRTSMVEELEEKLRHCEVERLSSTQRVQVLEGQLGAARTELADSLERQQELKDVLQRTQTICDERQAQLDKLSVRLCETQRELEERTHEVLDMDNALKERQGELQQRAKLLGQLDVAIREHKLEMERKVEFLQQSLAARQKELTERNVKEAKGFSQQLSECQQKLQKVLGELEACQHHCDSLTKELDDAKLRIRETEAQLCSTEEELTLKEARWMREEARLQSTLAALEQELELEKEQHSKELESLQHTRGQLLKFSEQISSSMRSSQEQLTVKVRQSQIQLEEAKAHCSRLKAQLDQAKIDSECSRSQASHFQAELEQSQAQLLHFKTQLEESNILYEQTRVHGNHLQAQLELLSAQLKQSRMQVSQLQTQLIASEKSVETSADSLLIKESEVTRLQAKISSIGRAAERQDLLSHAVSLPTQHTVTDPQERSFSPPLPSIPLTSPTTSRPCSTPPARSYLQPTSELHLSESFPPRHWPQSSSINSSMDFPSSLKGTLRANLIEQRWESSSPSVSTFLESADHSWQGLSTTETSAVTDGSFNPLTYMADRHDDTNVSMEALAVQQVEEEQHSESRRESGSTVMGQEDVAMDMNSLTGMLKFVNQTLAMQQDPSVWSATEHMSS